VNVLIEKPMAMTAEDCRKMCDAALRRGRTIAVSHNFLFSRAVTEASRRIAVGRAGRLESVVGFQMSTLGVEFPNGTKPCRPALL